MRVLVTGGTGYVGRFVLSELARAGHPVTLLGRSPLPPHCFRPWSLAQTAPALPPADALVHCAYDHVPGAYRGGEGDDREGYWRLNHDGSITLIDAAVRAGISRILFLSSRAVYADSRRGETLRETDPAEPGSLYGKLKLAIETALASRPEIIAASIRATGVYGVAPGTGHHKWEGLFHDFTAGKAISSRIGTELHGHDLAAAILLLLETGATGVFNASDLLLDRHDLLSRVKARTGSAHPPPAPWDGRPPGVMATEKLERLGWRPGGFERLDQFLANVCLCA
jgi:UDP-glucose 4-epimerase